MMMRKLLLVLVIIYACLGDVNVYPIYLGCDEVPIFNLPMHVFSFENCNGMSVNVTYDIKSLGGATVQSGTVVYPPGQGYTRGNGYLTVTFRPINPPLYPYTIHVYNLSPGVTETATIPCWSNLADSCNPVGYGLYYNHMVVTLPDKCVTIADSLWSDSSHGCSYTLLSPNYLQSADLRYSIAMQSDGNVVIYSPPGTAIWNSHTQNLGTGPYHLDMQSDSNLVSYDSTHTFYFHTNWGGGIYYPYHFTMGTDGVARVVDVHGTGIWAS